jgi:hypothetical protein
MDFVLFVCKEDCVLLDVIPYSFVDEYKLFLALIASIFETQQ